MKISFHYPFSDDIISMFTRPRLSSTVSCSHPLIPFCMSEDIGFIDCITKEMSFAGVGFSFGNQLYSSVYPGR